MGKKRRAKRNSPVKEVRRTHPGIIIAVVLVLIALTYAVYWPVKHNDFLAFDDDVYVTNNRHIELGITLASQGKMDEAISHFMKVLEVNPKEPRAHFNLGLVYESQGKINEAISEDSKCVSTNPENPNAYLFLGSLLEKQGKVDEAVVQYRRALEVDSRSVEARTALARLRGH